jgi:YD repeat-containing protein
LSERVPARKQIWLHALRLFPSGLNYSTTYTYGALDNLITVTQGSQTRTYNYDLLGRVTQATTPESGTTNFYYTTSGGALCSGDPNAVCRRTDARSITTTYSYDVLNRLTGKTYW